MSNNLGGKDYITLQSYVFGHRFKANQTVYEYILEFLLVALSEKESNGKYSKELFPLNFNKNDTIRYSPTNNVGLKRFIFFEKSKIDTRFNLDKNAYEYHLNLLRDKIKVEDCNEKDKNYYIKLIQELLYGFSGVLENRSWFAQSMLPICPHVITAEIMGTKSKRNENINPDEKSLKTGKNFEDIVDGEFETNRYNFMSRGGEVYYLHILSAINNNPNYKEEIELGFNLILNQFSEFENLCKLIQDTWINGANINTCTTKINKTLGIIPSGFKEREEYTLIELNNLLHSEMHPFEKIEILSKGIIVQIIVMCFIQARIECGKNLGYLIFDIECYKGKSNEEIKKIATLNFQSYEQDLLNALYKNVDIHRNKDNKGKEKSEEETIQDAIDDSIKVYRKLGKKIGIIRPINEKFIRFTLNEDILKFFVISLVKPKTKMTFDSFLKKLFLHFRIIIGKEQLMEEFDISESEKFNSLEYNKEAFQKMLKEAGFLRELSDSTSIVENPYMEV